MFDGLVTACATSGKVILAQNTVKPIDDERARTLPEMIQRFEKLRVMGGKSCEAMRRGP